MNNNFFDLSQKEQLLLIRQAGDKLDVSDMIIEKDFWVCWLLEKLFALPIKMAFKGGTSLSKVFNLIKRFSEDVDVTIDYLNFKETLDLENINRTQLKKISSILKEQLKTYVTRTVLPYFQEEASKILPKKSFEITLSSDGEKLQFYYPSIINSQSNYLRDHVLIEFGIRNSTEPCEKYFVTPYLAQIIGNNLFLPKSAIDTLSPIRTFWEKAVLIHVECHRDRLTKTPERLSRHWYDLYMLNQSHIGEQALSRKDILKNVLKHEKAFFNASYTHYDDCLGGKLCLIPKTTYQTNLTSDFNRMITAGMFYNDRPPTFDEIINSLKTLENKINSR